MSQTCVSGADASYDSDCLDVRSFARALFPLLTLALCATRAAARTSATCTRLGTRHSSGSRKRAGSASARGAERCGLVFRHRHGRERVVEDFERLRVVLLLVHELAQHQELLVKVLAQRVRLGDAAIKLRLPVRERLLLRTRVGLALLLLLVRQLGRKALVQDVHERTFARLDRRRELCGKERFEVGVNSRVCRDSIAITATTAAAAAVQMTSSGRRCELVAPRVACYECMESLECRSERSVLRAFARELRRLRLELGDWACIGRHKRC